MIKLSVALLLLVRVTGCPSVLAAEVHDFAIQLNLLRFLFSISRFGLAAVTSQASRACKPF